MRLRSALVTAAAAAALLAPVVVAPTAAAHGWITNPPSRQDHCAGGDLSFDCGAIQYEPQSVEAPKGSMKCSGDSGFDILDDESRPWPRTTIDSDVTMTWQITANHATSTWEYFVDGELWATFDDGGAQPDWIVHHTLTGLPEGDHLIFARWNVANTPMAFYNCVDVTVTGGGPGGGPGDGDGPGDGGPGDGDGPGDGAPGECEVTAWSAATVYTAGDQVSHEGTLYEARWWTLDENPATSGEWGVWADLGDC